MFKLIVSVLLLKYCELYAESIGSPPPFVCTDGSNINLTKVCDGVVDCPDSSDEIQKLCYHVICPSSSYRCNYGACIPRSSRCDGRQDCIDGSDELHCDILPQCSDREYRCLGSLECIQISKTCNGYLDCADGTDESETLCRDFPCPAHSYQCRYGGCVHREVMCDGVNDCVDGSDEEASECAAMNCQGDECLQYNCRSDEFSCLSERQCIPISRLCDGTRQCRDGTDEALDTCSNKNCSSGYFRCAYGGCIPASLKCNLEPNCQDFSDEEESMCGVPIPQGACRLPMPRPGVHVSVSNCPLCRPGQIVPELTGLNFSCAAGGSLEGPTTAFCQNNQWVPQIPTCISESQDITCPPLNSPGTRKRCEVLWGPRQGWISCNDSIPVGTKVILECPEFYERESGALHITCLHDGTWSQLPLRCRPVCGVRETSAIALIVKGWESSPEEPLPWHATLFSHENGHWTFFCGGSLIGERVVLTAGHCVWKTDPKTIRVVLAGFSSNFTLDESDEDTQIFDVSRIEVQRAYHDHEGNYGSDLAIIVLNKPALINSRVNPVCLNWSPESDVSFRGGEMGLVAGMGITENSTISQRLRVTSEKIIPEEECRDSQKRDFRKYLTYTTFCAGWNNGTSVCNGDSGGGLVLQRKNSTIWDLHGIVSISPRKIGSFTCDPQYYTVFTKVAIYGNWIEGILETIPVVGPPDLDQLPNEDILV
ncbi:modular serine protease [Diachasma alloeum]|uniref:modular serine protease n=1 Tax=Diachasma alloeum TaxID=454923 RepID=UPI00073825F0|nr:modular serine protease [Diachasma alloeum]